MERRSAAGEAAFAAGGTGETGAFWAGYLAKKPESVTLSGKLPALANRGPAVDVSRRLSAEVVADVRELAKSLSVSLDQLLTALVCTTCTSIRTSGSCWSGSSGEPHKRRRRTESISALASGPS